MSNRQNPFTHTYGSAGNAYIDIEWSKKAIISDDLIIQFARVFVPN